MTLVKSFVTTVGVALFGTLMLGSTVSAQDSCPACSNADTVLKSCNTALLMNTWPGTMVFQPNEAQAPCACNQNFYGLIEGCLVCQSSTTAKYSVKPLDQYQQVCLSFHQAWQPIYIPNTPSTSSTAEPTATPEPSNDGPGGVSHVGLSSGAIAGIIVSAIALIVALSVAVYVYQRRKRDLQKQQEEDELYKYNSQARNSYMEVPLPQYTGMIQPSLPSLPQLTNLRVMNPDADDDDVPTKEGYYHKSFEVQRNSSPGWRRGSFDDD